MSVDQPLFKLMKPVVLEMGHYGFAGYTSYRTTVQEDGSWKVVGLLNGEEYCTYGEGQLNQAELHELFDSLLALDHGSLSPLVGNPTVNGGSLVFEFGTVKSVLNLNERGQLPASGGNEAVRLSEFSKAVAKLINPIRPDAAD